MPDGQLKPRRLILISLEIHRLRAVWITSAGPLNCLMGGHIKEGLEIMRSVLAAVGFTLPAGPKEGATFTNSETYSDPAARTQFYRTQRGRDLPVRSIPYRYLLGGVYGLGAVDLIRGADFQCRHLLLALRAGEPFRVARAMAMEAAQTASRGASTRKRALQIAQRAEELAHRVGHPHAIGLSIWASGVGAYLVGHWKKAEELCEQAAEVLRDQCTGATWELTIANRFMLNALLNLGHIAEVSRRVPGLLAAALDQGKSFRCHGSAHAFEPDLAGCR